MGLFLTPDDERRCYVRTLYNRELGREPTGLEQGNWAAYIVANGADLTLAAIRDSAEAQAFRKARGW